MTRDSRRASGEADEANSHAAVRVLRTTLPRASLTAHSEGRAVYAEGACAADMSPDAQASSLGVCQVRGMSEYGARMARLGLVIGLALALLLGCTRAVELMANDPLSTEQIRGLKEVDQRKEGAHTSLGKPSPSKFIRLLLPEHRRAVDQDLVDRVAAAARREGWTVTLIPSTGDYVGRKTIEGLDVRLTITPIREDQQIGIFMVAVNEER